MKKKLLLLILLFLSFLLISCNKKDNIDISYDMINDFEVLDDVILNKYSNLFGRIGLNTNKEFVTSNDCSLLLMPKGDITVNNNKPRVYFDIKENVRDLTNYSHLKFDIYNDSDFVVEFILRLTFNDGKGGLMSTMDKKISLNPKEWTNVLHRLNTEALALIFNVNYLENIEFIFDFYDKAPCLYLDNLSLRKTSKEFKEIDIILDENEICSFDKDYQAYSFISSGYGAVDGKVPILSINKNPLFSKSGNSLKMIAPKGLTKDASWPYIKLSPKIVNHLDLSKLDENSKIVFDVFNDGTKSIIFSVDYHSNYDDNIFYKRSYEIKPKQWTTIETSLKDLNSNSDSKKLLSENLGYINICYGEFADREDQVFYFDQFRIEN